MTEAIRLHYLRVDSAGEKLISDEFVTMIGYHRSHAIRVLKLGSSPKGLKKQVAKWFTRKSGTESRIYLQNRRAQSFGHLKPFISENIN